jgi:hypothetical protein
MTDIKKLLADVRALEQDVANKKNALKNASRWTVQLSEKQKQDPANAKYVAQKKAAQLQARKDLEKAEDDLETANIIATDEAQRQALNPDAAEEQKLIDAANRRGEIYERPIANLIDVTKPLTAQDDYAGFTLDSSGKVFGPSGVEGQNGKEGIFVPAKDANGVLANQFVTSSNKAIELFLKNYQGPGELNGLKKRLVASGYVEPSQVNGTAWLSGLVDMLGAYSGDYLQKIKFEGATDVPGIDVFMAQKKIGSGSTPYRVITTRGDAKKLLNDYLNNLIGSPATAEEESAFYNELNKAENKARVSTVGRTTTGSVLTDADRLTIAAKVARKRLRGSNVDELLSSNIGSTVASDIASMQRYAAQYGIQMTSAEALKRVADGIGQDNYVVKQQERLKLVAKQLHPKLAAHIDAGGTVKDIADEYAYAKARKLGVVVPMSTTDADVMSAVNSGISISDFDIEMQKKPEWRFTDEANQIANNFTNTMLKTFGLVG